MKVKPGPLTKLLVGCVCLQAVAVVAMPVNVGGGNADLQAPPNPSASLVLLSGDAGLSDRDPLQRATLKYLDKGIAVLAIDQRTIVRAAMKFASQTATPVSIAAMSSGVRRLAGAMAAPGFRARSVILVSGNLDAARETIGRPDLLPPTLVIHHRNDGCGKTPPSQVERFVAWGGSKVTVRWMDGGDSSGDPCGPQSHHGMAGLDDELVQAIVGFMDR